VGIEQDGGHRTDVRQLSETFAYNAAGQLIQASDARGAVTQYSYYPSDDPTGERGQDGAQSDPEQAGGYLARLVKDPASENRQLQGNPAQVTRGYSYDINGNPATVLDGKGNATHFTYNTHNRVVEMVARQPLGYKTAFGYDANDNLLEARTSFDHHQYDPATRTTGLQSTTAFQLFEYNSLDKVVRRTIRANDREITQTFVRDSDENIVREIQPLGNVIEYEYDERGLQVARRFGVGTKDEVAVRHTYTRNGRLRSTLDGRGNIARYDYDGFHRYRGFANAAGTAKRQWLDAMGNVTRVQVQGDLVTVNEHGDPVSREVAPLLESWFQYDELNRRVRVDRAWNDPLTGEPLGKSQWDGKEGVVSAVIEYSDSNLLARIWQETGNITHLDYDGANRPILVSDETGESVSIDYDENSNPIRVEHLGPPLVGEGEDRVRQLINFEFDALDRVVAGSLDGGPRASWDYNALGLVTEYKNEAEVSTKYLHDGFGRLSGRATTAAVPPSVDGKESEQLLVQRVERDDNNRLVAWINAADHRTGYTYDALNRLSSIVYTDGTVKQFERDGNGNIVRLVDPNRTAVNNRFDTQNHLAERLIESANGGDRQAGRSGTGMIRQATG